MCLTIVQIRVQEEGGRGEVITSPLRGDLTHQTLKGQWIRVFSQIRVTYYDRTSREFTANLEFQGVCFIDLDQLI